MEVSHISSGPATVVHGKIAVVFSVTDVLWQVMRGYDGQFAHTSLSLVQHMLLTNQDLHTRVSGLIDNVSSNILTHCTSCHGAEM